MPNRTSFLEHNLPKFIPARADHSRLVDERPLNLDAVEKVGADLFCEVFMGRFTLDQGSRAACRPI
jgi:hypothetical protein